MGRKTRLQKKKRQHIYQQESGGWVVRDMGAGRRYSSKKNAEKALRKHRFKISAKACVSKGLGGSVVSRYQSTMGINKSTRYQNQNKTSRNTSYKQRNHKQTKKYKAPIRKAITYNQGSNKAKARMIPRSMGTHAKTSARKNHYAHRGKSALGRSKQKYYSKNTKAKGRSKMLSTWARQKALSKCAKAKARTKGHGQKSRAGHKTKGTS